MKWLSFLLILLIFIGLSTFSVAKDLHPAKVQQYNLLTGIVPEPQEVFSFLSEIQYFQFTKDTVLVVENAADMVGAELLAEDILNRSGIKLHIINGIVPATKSFVFIGRSDIVHNFGPSIYPISELGETKPEGYRMVVDSNGIIIEGHDERGTLYGVQTIRQLIKSNATVEPIAIRDWPQMQWRVSYAGLIDSNEISEHIKRCARLKINAIVLETYWNGQGNWWYNPSDGRQQKAMAFFEECKKYKIEAIPFVQGFGWGYGVTDLDPMATEGEWGEEEAILYHNNSTQLNRRNVVYTQTGPIVVSAIDGKKIYKNGVDYRIIDGLTVRPFEVTNKPYEIQTLATGSIINGEKVKVGYNAVTTGAHKSYCPAEPLTYKVVDQTIDNVMQTYKPKVIHIGHDELFNSMTDSRCIQSGLSREQLVLQDVLHWYNRIRSHDPSTKIMMWYDFIRTEGPSGALLSVIDKLPKDIIICPWVYGIGSDTVKYMQTNVSLEIQNGFQIIGTPSGYFMDNSLCWNNILKNELSPNGKALGMMFTYWGDGELMQSCLPASAELMWSGNKVNRELFGKYEQITNKLKQNGLALTFELKRQIEAIARYFNANIVAGRAPKEISEGFRSEILGDTEYFKTIYGPKAWNNFEMGVFPEQQAVMACKILAMIDCMSLYDEAEYDNSEGKKDDASKKLALVIDRLERLEFLGKETADNYRNKAMEKFLSSEGIFGQALNVYRDGNRSNLIVTLIPKEIMRNKKDVDGDRIIFSRPINLNRIEGRGLTGKQVSVSKDGQVFEKVQIDSTVYIGDGQAISAIEFKPQFDGSIGIYEQRNEAIADCYVANTPPVIDGNLSDFCWLNNDPVTGFFTPEKAQALLQTRVWLTYDKNNMYVAFEADRKPNIQLVTNMLRADDNVYEDESIQVFLDTNLDRQTYYQLVINTAGVLFDKSSTREGEKWNSNAKVACSIENDKWVAEIAVPLKSLVEDTNVVGRKWGMNFCRSSNAKNQPGVDSSWAELSAGTGYFFLQPSKFGTIQFKNVGPCRKIKKILVLGNSLTCHGPSTEALGWTGNWGMAATSEANDYAHTFYRFVCQAQPDSNPELKIDSLFEGKFEEYDYAEWLDYNADLIIIQTGDNVPADRATRELFGDKYKQMVAKFKSSNNPLILCTSLWSGKEAPHNKFIKEACEQNGAYFVDLSDIAANPQNRAAAEHHFTNPGVNWHPGNRGMAEIAHALWDVAKVKLSCD